jgi:hypothetical protein
MKCPHCAVEISLFSKEMAVLGKTKVCPHCGGYIKIGLRNVRFFTAFASVAVIAILAGISSPIMTGVAGGVGALFGLGLTKR